MQKKGLSTIVTTLIIIVLVLVAIGIVWIVVRNVIQTGTEGVGLSQFTLNAEIKDVTADNVSDNVNLTVKRNPGEGEILKIKFIFSTETDSEIVTEEVSLKELEERRFNFHLTKLHVSDLVSISIVPIIKQNEKEILGNVADKYIIGKGKKTTPGQTCNPKTCVGLDYNCGTWTNGTCYDTQNINCNTPGCGTHATCPSGTCVCDSNWQDCNNDNTCECDLTLNICSGGSCVVNPLCTPATCASLNYNCGNWTDGCSGTLSCGVFGNGSCQTGQTCVGGSCVLNTSVLCGPLRTYYIDYANGNDANNGTCSNSAWKRAPGMTGFSGSYAHSVGDKFIFKGGVIWPNAVFPMNIVYNGNITKQDYYGVDKRWYTGSSWSRPIFDMQGQLIGTNNVIIFMDNYGASYVTFDNIEFTNYYWDSSTCPWTQNTFFWNGYGNVGINVFNCYFHGWTHAPSAGDCAVMMGGNGRYQNVAYNLMDGTASGGNSGNSGAGYNYYNNTVHDMANGPVGGAVSVHDNLIYNIRNSFAGSAYHTNGIEVWLPPGETTQYIYNNVLHDLSSGTYPLPIGPGFAQTGNVTAYIFNNVMWNIGWGMPFVVDCSCAVGIVCTPNQVSVYIWSNTVSTLPSDSWTACIRLVNRGNGNVGLLDLRDNHCITNSGKLYAFDTGVNASTLIDITNLLIPTSTATNIGYTISNMFAPISPNSITVNGGTDLSSVFNKDRNGVSRPQGSTWDIGAYEYPLD